MKRLPLFIIFVLLFSFLFIAPKTNNAWAAPTTLTPTADAMIISDHPDSKYGSNSHLDVAKTSTYKIRDLIRFDLGSIPSNATITSATFSIYLYGCGSLSQTVDDLNIARITADWQEYQVTWNTHKSKFDMSSTLNKTAPCSLNNQYHNFDVKSFVENWRNGTWPNYGLGLYGNEYPQPTVADWIKFFYGREDPANKPPKLAITYTLPTSPTDGSTNVGTDNSSNTSGGETTSKPGEEKTATQSATIGAKKATVSTSQVESKGISALRIAILAALTILLAGAIAGYIIYRRRKKQGDKKDKEPEKPESTKEEPKDVPEESTTGSEETPAE